MLCVLSIGILLTWHVHIHTHSVYEINIVSDMMEGDDTMVGFFTSNGKVESTRNDCSDIDRYENRDD